MHTNSLPLRALTLVPYPLEYTKKHLLFVPTPGR
jgi:hypothetical protein